MTYDDKPDLPTEEEALAHYGVLGMKWGKTRAKATTAQIKLARKNRDEQGTKLGDEHLKLEAMGKNDKGRRAQERKVANMQTAYLKNPDRVTAVRLTRGEKAAVTLFTLMSANPVGAPAAIANVAVAVGSSAASRRIEYKQDKGAYDKK